MSKICLCSDQLLDFFKAGGDAHRQLIIALIQKNKKINATNLLEHLKISQPTLSHHIKILKDANLITAERNGKETFYSINHQHITSCCQSMVEEVSH